MIRVMVSGTEKQKLGIVVSGFLRFKEYVFRLIDIFIRVMGYLFWLQMEMNYVHKTIFIQNIRIIPKQ